MPRRSNDADIGALPGSWIDHVECIDLCLYAGDYLFTWPSPAGAGIAEAGDVLVRALRVWFCDTGYLNVGHNGSFRKQARNCAQFFMRKPIGRTDIFGAFFCGRMSEVSIWHRIRKRKEDARLTADASVRSPDEIAALVRALTDAQWIRLRKVSGYFAWLYDLDSDDLLQEAFCRALTGSRKCPRNVDLIRFLVEAMRSIANGEADKIENKLDVVPVVQPGALVEAAVDLEDSKKNQEDAMMAAVSDEAIRQALLGLFPNDRQACDLVDGILLGYEGEELRALTGLDQKGYASKRRFMRRMIDKKNGPLEGRKP